MRVHIVRQQEAGLAGAACSCFASVEDGVRNNYLIVGETGV